MTESRLNLRFDTAQQLFDEIPEISEDVEARPDGESLPDFLTKLTESETPEEAVTICAYSLPQRHAVWWGHECLMRFRDRLNEHDLAMLELAAAWVAAPDEDNRRTALAAASDIDNPTAGTWVAYAVGWSGGSMSTPDLPPVPPPPHLTAKALNAAVLTSLALAEIDQREHTIGAFVRMALQLATEG